MILFDKPGKKNTEETIKIALAEAQKHQMPIVVSSNEGTTTKAIYDLAQAQGVNQRIISVTHAAGYLGDGIIEMPEELRAQLEAKGVAFVTAAHALSAGERGFSKQYGGIFPLEIVAKTLCMFGQGTKVCVEVSVMAMDAGLLPFGEPIVAIGGTGRGADTAAVLTPSYSANILSTHIHSILCKPYC